jgi:hypothetical protein
LSGGLQPALVVAGAGLLVAGSVLINRQPAAQAHAPVHAAPVPGKTAHPESTR